MDPARARTVTKKSLKEWIKKNPDAVDPEFKKEVDQGEDDWEFQQNVDTWINNYLILPGLHVGRDGATAVLKRSTKMRKMIENPQRKALDEALSSGSMDFMQYITYQPQFPKEIEVENPNYNRIYLSTASNPDFIQWLDDKIFPVKFEYLPELRGWLRKGGRMPENLIKYIKANKSPHERF